MELWAAFQDSEALREEGPDSGSQITTFNMVVKG